jgi:hypothetical protein
MQKTVKCAAWVSRKFVPQIALVSGNKSPSRAVWRIKQRKASTLFGMKNKAFFRAAVALMPFAGIFAALRAAYEKHVPIGYEDENGFHLGSNFL